jgi:5'-3' exonuclease
MRLHVFDGTYELFRAFYGAPARTNRRGEEVGATRAFLQSFASFVQRSDVTHVGCAFDHVIESFRNDLFDGYKTGEGIDPALWAQFPLAEAATEALGIVTWRMVDFEADDALCTAAARHANDERVGQVVILSPDKDLMQCVRGQRVVTYDRMRKIEYDEASVIEKFGIPPLSIPDYLALVGDSADGLPGVPRWGAKSSSTILAQYQKLENVPLDEKSWTVKVRGAKGLAENLREHLEDAKLYKRLATLREDVPLQETLDDLHWNAPRLDALAELCERVEDDRVLHSFKDG